MRISQTYPIQLDTDLEDLPDKLPPDVALCLFRITQEALRNVLRHANASQAEVSLKRLDGGLELIVRDNGKGFDHAKFDGGKPGLGHASMRQRVRLVGGKIDIDSLPGQGAKIIVWVTAKG